MAVHHAAAIGPWYRLHVSTWVVVALVSCGVLFVEIPAEVTVHFMHYTERCTQYKHGWPWVYLERWSDFDASDPQNSITPDAIPWLHTVCWNVLARPGAGGKTTFRPRYVVPNALTGIFVIGAAGLLAEWWRRRRQHVWQFSLGDLLTGVLLCATALGWWRYQHDHRNELFDHLRVLGTETPAAARDPASDAFLVFGYAGPAWLSRLVGMGPLEVFNEPVTAVVIEDDPAKPIRDLRKRKRLLTHLRELSLGPSLLLLSDSKLIEVDEELIRNLAQLDSVERLSIIGCRLDDRALDRLAEMPNLREISLRLCDGMTDAGLARLRASIEELQLFKTPPGREHPD